MLDLLENDSLHFDEIVRTIEKDANMMGSLLSVLGIKRMIINREGVYNLL